MKRSEMENHINNLLHKAEADAWHPDDTATEILKLVEEKGMLPASFYYNDSGYTTAKEAVDEHEMYGDFQWEDE